MNLLKLTTKQQEILKLLYRYRFLDRIQLQAFLGHKDKRRVGAWLKDLREKHYVEWIYSTGFTEKTKPAIYYLGLNGIRHLKKLTTTDEDGQEQPAYPLPELRKRYREANLSRTFTDRCMLVADCCLTLEKQNTSNDSNGATTSGKGNTITYFYETEADYLPQDGYYHFILESELIHPGFCFSKDTYEANTTEPVTLHSYLLEIFDATLPRYRVRKRLKDYIRYLDEEDYTWKEETGTEELPIILLVCPTLTDLIYVKRATRKLLQDNDMDEDEEVRIRVTTSEKLKTHGVFGDIWEKV